ncbi:hypothetical protein GCM10027614_10790 [Micromonospora vulcania]
MEAFRRLVPLPVFKTGVVRDPGQAGSIPVRLRQNAAGVDAMGEGTVDPRRRVPRTDALLADPLLAAATVTLGRERVKTVVTRAQERARRGEIDPEDVRDVAVAALPAPGPRAVLNATGVVLHTNLGRAPLSAAAVAAVTAAAGHTDVELDLNTGRRARRGRDALDALAGAVPDAQAVHVVNNGAAALVLAATALAAGREIVVSRGELVEIGDGFRLPDLLESTGARLREVGTTNRTTVADYAAAIGPQTGFVLKVHPSNFQITGFTAATGVRELATLGVPVVADIGSGLLTADPLLPDEPDAASTLRAGATLVTASGDKLLGARRPGCCSATRSWSTGSAVIRWPGRCAWTSSPSPRWPPPCTTGTRRPGPRCTPTRARCGSGWSVCATGSARTAARRRWCRRSPWSVAAAPPAWSWTRGR